jgi:hypothetical protein
MPSARAPKPTVPTTPASSSSEGRAVSSPSPPRFFRSHRLDAIHRPAPIAHSRALLSPAPTHAFLPMLSPPDSPAPPPPPPAPPGPDLVGYARVWVRADLNLTCLDLFFSCPFVCRLCTPTIPPCSSRPLRSSGSFFQSVRFESL